MPTHQHIFLPQQLGPHTLHPTYTNTQHIFYMLGLYYLLGSTCMACIPNGTLPPSLRQTSVNFRTGKQHGGVVRTEK